MRRCRPGLLEKERDRAAVSTGPPGEGAGPWQGRQAARKGVQQASPCSDLSAAASSALAPALRLPACEEGVVEELLLSEAPAQEPRPRPRSPPPLPPPQPPWLEAAVPRCLPRSVLTSGTCGQRTAGDAQGCPWAARTRRVPSNLVGPSANRHVAVVDALLE